MDQITGALVGIGLVLSAVFVPMAFFGGSTGVIYRQFSITIVSAMALSVLVAIVFHARAVRSILKPVEKGHEHGEGGLFGRFFHWFNVGSSAAPGLRVGGRRHPPAQRRASCHLLAIVAVLGLLFVRMPTLPARWDQGVMFNQVMLPAGATQERTLAVLGRSSTTSSRTRRTPSRAIFTVAGFSFGGSGQHMGIGFMNLKRLGRAQGAGQDVKSVAGRAMARVRTDPRGHGVRLRAAGGDRARHLGRLHRADAGPLRPRPRRPARRAQPVPRHGGAGQAPGRCAPTARRTCPSWVDIDHAKAGALGLSVADINDTLSPPGAAAYINDFLDRGRIKKVHLQGDAGSRMTPGGPDKWYVRNGGGRHGAVRPRHARTGPTAAPRAWSASTASSSMELLGQAAPGLSSGEAMAVEEIMAKLPPGIGYDWSAPQVRGAPFRLAGAGAVCAVAAGGVPVPGGAVRELVGAPAVMLVVPLGVLGALLAASGRGLSNDVYFQVGLLATIGLSSKNAILIVEFAKAQMEEGRI